MDIDELFPHIKRSVENYLFDEEGNIPRSKILAIGSMMIVLSLMLAEKAFAAHRTHSSHRTHSTHRTHSSHRNNGHTTHYTHSTHSTHSTHGTHVTHTNTHSTHSSHTSHSNTASHSNSLYSAEGDVSYGAPAAASVKGVIAPPVASTAESFKLPTVNENIEIPTGTPGALLLPDLAVPQTTPATEADADEPHVPPEVEDFGLDGGE